jgi:hypothetical protein
MPLDDAVALKLALDLALIPKFPSWSQPAVAKVAEILAEWCESEPEAERLVNAAITAMPEWGGIPALKAIHDRQTNRHDWEEPAWVADGQYDPGPRDGAGCKRCADGAVFDVIEGHLVARVCACSTHLESVIRHVEALNRAASDMRRIASRARMRGRLKIVDHQRIREEMRIAEQLTPPKLDESRLPKFPTRQETVETLNRAFHSRMPAAPS